MDSDVDLWNAARWSGVSFFVDPSGATPPGVGLVFEDGESARTLFERWRALGANVGETLRVAIIEGHIPRHVGGYSVHIGPRYQSPVAPLAATPMSGFIRMKAQRNSRTLATFKSDFTKHGCYRLFPVTLGALSQLRTHVDLAITMSAVVFRHVTDIEDPDDPDIEVLRPKRTGGQL